MLFLDWIQSTIEPSALHRYDASSESYQFKSVHRQRSEVA